MDLQMQCELSVTDKRALTPTERQEFLDLADEFQEIKRRLPPLSEESEMGRSKRLSSVWNLTLAHIYNQLTVSAFTLRYVAEKNGVEFTFDPAITRAVRNGYADGACGVCGK